MIDAVKNFLCRYGVGVLILLSPIKTALLAITFLVLTDFVFGIFRARKLKEKITSNKLKRTVVKLGLYLSVALIAYITQICLLHDFFELFKVVCALIALVEFKSIVESIAILSNNCMFEILIQRLNGISLKNHQRIMDDKDIQHEKDMGDLQNKHDEEMKKKD